MALSEEALVVLQLNDEERDLLTRILEERYLELRRELFHTDHYEFKRRLKEREHVLESLLEKLAMAELAA
jgi:hypothetical protein